MPLTVTPSPATSLARENVNAARAPLDVLYAVPPIAAARRRSTFGAMRLAARLMR